MAFPFVSHATMSQSVTNLRSVALAEFDYVELKHFQQLSRVQLHQPKLSFVLGEFSYIYLGHLSRLC